MSGQLQLTTAKKMLIMEHISSLPVGRQVRFIPIAAGLEQGTFLCGNQDDFFAVGVMRNAPRRSNQMVEISGSMNNAVHLNRMTANDVEHQI